MAGSTRAQGLGNTLDGILRRFVRREPKQSRSRALVEAVVQATDELIRRGEPIDQVTVEQVSERAGIGPGSFYEYFASKDSVLGVLIGKVTRSNFDELSRKLDALDHGSLDEVIEAFAHTIVETYLGHPNRTRVILEGVGRLGLSQLVHDEKDRFARVMAVRAAPFLPGEPLDAISETMRFVADAIMGVLVFTALRGGKIDPERVAADLAALAVATIRRRHPRSELTRPPASG
jgi:AcrR family transcriptional regulator